MDRITSACILSLFLICGLAVNLYWHYRGTKITLRDNILVILISSGFAVIAVFLMALAAISTQLGE